MDNPLLATDRLPAFHAIEPAHVEPAIDTVLAENRATLERLLADGGPYTWEGLVAPVEAMNERLMRVFSPVSHLNSVMDSEALRAAYNACLPRLSAYDTELRQNTALYEAYRAVAERDDFAALPAERRAAVEHALRDFRLAGVALAPQAKRRYAEIASRLSELSARFQEQLLDATGAWHRDLTDTGALAGLPESALGVARQAAEQAGVSGYRLTLEFPSVQAVLTHADDRALRREVYEAFTTRASEVGPHAGQFDNGPVMDEILALRHEQAQLLGFDNYAELALEPRMARSVDEVMGFLEDLARRSVPRAREEFAELESFARERDGLERLEAWDATYYSEKLRQARFGLSPEDLRPWFPASRVMEGLFKVVERLYGLHITPGGDGVETWHPDVGFHEIRDADGGLVGQFYTDLYARAHKRGGAWMDVCRSRNALADAVQVPVAYLTCNFTPPVGGAEALLTHDEVQTLFHEFGHGLHHMLTRVGVPSVAGISGVPWDAVELPSQFMENWTWEREALDAFARHHETGEPLPESLFGRMRAARTFQSAMQMVRQLEFSLFDMRLHAEYDPDTGARVQAVLDEVRGQVAVMRPPAFNRFANGFAHIFAGGYAAGYYSYKWAEVLSADAFSRFEEEGLFSQEAGGAFRHWILERGGSEDFMTLYRGFRGREPSIEALLRHSGLAA
ncbi:Oligopeptidase A [wastewater metagenome]|uniref:oligopeptidase A n=5 Tax=root TaxID=1 RepID=A0A5B8RD30_9ZZZZ|nr:M3 family metallopeptidase [Arhodomonas aquaeolei]MCS4503106.1 M3 family metallopeptidase [Arhodomonas aquaeolei]QEA06750.1 oligopeptidase A [uncultured organism]